MRPIRDSVEDLLLHGAYGGNRRLRGTCGPWHGHRAWPWTFLKIAVVEPTNNARERALRHPVIWRKLSFGTQSALGGRFVETIRSVFETCRQQTRAAFNYLTTALEAHDRGKHTPTLLPRARTVTFQGPTLTNDDRT